MPPAKRRSRESLARRYRKRSAWQGTGTWFIPARCRRGWNTCCEKRVQAMPFSQLEREAWDARWISSQFFSNRKSRRRLQMTMRIREKAAARLVELGVELRQGVSLSEYTSLGIGGSTDMLLLRRYETIPAVMSILADEHIPHR